MLIIYELLNQIQTSKFLNNIFLFFFPLEFAHHFHSTKHNETNQIKTIRNLAH